jgi:DNA primase
VSLTPAFLDELRARTLLSALIAPSVKLIKAGREYKACCPFHSEKTPSFYVNDEKGFYHCFGCGAHGDAIRFLTDARGLPFMDAVKELASKSGMDVPAPDPRTREKAERSAGLYEVMEAANRWFIEQLEGAEGSAARGYLKERGISEGTKKRFGFGFAPDSRGKLKNALERFGIDKLVEAGLLIKPDDGKEPYDRFRGRLTFPIRDARGRCIAFSARILGTGEPKYLNSPDTPLFDKGRTLFNLDLASAASRTTKRLIIVEGQMDVIALDQAGLGEAVAPLGTAVTEAQLLQASSGGLNSPRMIRTNLRAEFVSKLRFVSEHQQSQTGT